MNDKNTNFLIKIGNQAEKLAALYYLKDLMGIDINKEVIDNTIKGSLHIQEYPFVGCISHEEIITSYPNNESFVKDGKIFDFKDLHLVKDYYNTTPEPPIMIGEYKVTFKENGDIKVGCQEVDLQLLSKIYNKAWSLHIKNEETKTNS